MLAYYVEWHMREALKPLLFDDHVAAERQRASVVQKAKRSPAARAKAAGKCTDDDRPVHSFRTLLADLGTLTANTIRVADGDATFTMLTKPTPVQQRSFELLGVTPQLQPLPNTIETYNLNENSDFCALGREASA